MNCKKNFYQKILFMKLLEKINFFSAIYIFIWAISPPLTVIDFARFFAIISSFIWLFSTILLFPNVFIKPSISSIFIFTYIIYIALLILFKRNISLLIQQSQFIILTFMGFISDVYIRKKPKYLKLIFWIILFIIPIWIFITLRAYEIYPYISRKLSSSFTGFEYYTIRGIGGYGFIYNLVILVPSIFYLVYNKVLKSTLLNFYLLFILIISYYIIFKSSYTIALLITLITTSIIILINKINFKRFFILAYSFLFILLSLYFMFPYINSIIKISLEGTMHLRKYNDILESFQSNNFVGSFKARIDLYLRSIKTFFDYPILGSIFRQNQYIGGHSFLLDNYARFGIFMGTIITLIILFKPFVNIYSRNYSVLSLSILVALFMLINFNTIGFSLGVSIFVIFPVSYRYSIDR